MSVLITKADGEQEPFNPHKLLRSLERAGAPKEVAEDIEREITRELRPGMTTGELYRRAFVRLRGARREVAARYSLKRALLDLGPSGFPFEEYLSRLFTAEGCTAHTDQIIQGACVEHEVDVTLDKDGERIYVEAKFHNEPGYKTDLKVALYVKARLDDIAAFAKASAEMAAVPTRGMLVTNTKFTSQAIQFASCTGVELLGWEYPQGNTLQDRIEAVRLYPVTVLTTLSRRQKMALLEQKNVLCRSLPQETRALAAAGVSGAKLQEVLDEAGALCTTGKGLK